ncbi:hypothetical protein [Nocardia jejuensis]|uniref:hypothetical protein n=1 Tax=Nocardia jejuensis TaxID=328049 RepID=UPI000AD3FB0E|nr:hypothetical protein [Nocardia jejuensis]
MSRRTRLAEFPGGLLEFEDYYDQSDSPGVHLEQPPPCPRARDYTKEDMMRWKPACLGYLRIDISGSEILRDQSRIRALADRLGYDFADFVLYDPRFGRPPLARLKAQATRLAAEAVIVPGAEHFAGGRVPESLVRQLDVITVNPEETYARYAIPRDTDAPPATAGES